MPFETDALARSLWQLVLLLGGAQAVLLALFGWLGRAWLGRILTRERAKLTLENDRAIAEMRAQLDRGLSATTAALSVFASGHQAAQERRLAAVTTLWTEITNAREAASPGLLFFDILRPVEYDSALQAGSKTRALVERLPRIAELEKGFYPIFTVDAERPFLPDELYALFTLYQQVLGRAMWLLRDGLENGHVVPWHEDAKLRRIITSTIGAEELERAAAREFKSLASVLSRIQLRILEGCQAVVSGKTASAASLAGAHELVALAGDLEREARQNRERL